MWLAKSYPTMHYFGIPRHIQSMNYDHTDSRDNCYILWVNITDSAGPHCRKMDVAKLIYNGSPRKKLKGYDKMDFLNGSLLTEKIGIVMNE